MTVDLWFDPGCPFCWRTSRWLIDVAPHRGFDIGWHSISLLEKNGAAENVPDRFRARVLATHRLLRVAERLRNVGGNDAVGRFYTEVGTQIHHDGVEAGGIDIERVVTALGFDGDLAAAADDRGLDPVIRVSMEAGLRLTGPDVGTPIVAIDGAAFFGPVLDPVPEGADALRVFDAVATLMSGGQLWELKRSRNGPPQTLPRRPHTVLAPSGA